MNGTRYGSTSECWTHGHAEHEKNPKVKGNCHDKGYPRVYEDKAKDRFATMNGSNRIERRQYEKQVKAEWEKVPGHKSVDCPNKMRVPGRHTAAAIQIFDRQIREIRKREAVIETTQFAEYQDRRRNQSARDKIVASVFTVQEGHGHLTDSNGGKSTSEIKVNGRRVDGLYDSG